MKDSSQKDAGQGEAQPGQGKAHTLDDKVAAALECISGTLREHAGGDPRRAAVAWTGGKDSTLVLALYKHVLAEQGLDSPDNLKALNLDTGVKFPEVMDFRDRLATDWGVGLNVIRPEIDLKDYPVAKNKQQCCLDLKINPLKRAVKGQGIALLFTGIRADEHGSRQDRPLVEHCSEPDHVRVHPILEFTEMDVWAFIAQQSLPYCSLYDQGYRSLGCVPCTVPPEQQAALGERGGRDREKDEILSTLHDLGYF